MIEGMEKFIGRKLNDTTIEQYRNTIGMYGGCIVTRPDFYRGNIAINMNIHVNKDMIITDFTGDKCYSHYSGLYNRCHNVYDRSFTKRDIAYLRGFVRKISIEGK